MRPGSRSAIVAGLTASFVAVLPAVSAPIEADIPFVSRDARAVETPSEPSAWGGPRTGREPTLSDRVVKYKIDATLDPKSHTVKGREQLSWRNRSDRTVHTVFLHLYLNAFEGNASTFFTEIRERAFTFRSGTKIEKGQWGHIQIVAAQQQGRDIRWSFVHPDGGPETDHTVVRFDLPEAVPAGAWTTLDITFSDQLPRVVARTGWFGTFHMVAQWFPKIGVLELAGERGATGPRWNVHEFHANSEFYADWGEYDVSLTVPRGYQIAATGEEQGAPVTKGDQVTRRFTQGDVHDFAWMAVDNFAPPLEGKLDVPGGQPVTVKVFYPPEYRPSAAPALRATMEAIQFFSRTLGPYPYRTSTCILPPHNATEAGGMEYQTLFTSLGFSSVEPDSFQALGLDMVTIHEFGHGYFYGLLASNEFEEPLLDEGLNDYWDLRLLRARGRDIVMTTPLLRRLGIAPRVPVFDFERMMAVFDLRPPDAIGENAWNRLSRNSYGLVYARTATVFHDLEERLGRPVIERAFADYYQRWHFRHPSVADLRESLAESSGQRAVVEEVFREHVYGAEVIDDRISELSSVEELPLPGTRFVDNHWDELTEEQLRAQIKDRRRAWKKEHPDAKPGEGPFPFRTAVTVRRDGAQVPQTLTVEFEDGSTETRSWNEPGRWQRFVFHKPVRARAAWLDREQRVLLDHDKLNDARSRQPNHAAARRWSADLSTIAQVLLSLLESL